jgi:hypothetical protein
MNNLSWAYQAAGKADLALPLLEETLRRMKAKFRPEHPNTLQTLNNLAVVYCAVKHFDKAEPLYREELHIVKQKSGADSPAYAGALAMLGLNLLQQQKWPEAEPLLRECLAIRAKTQPDAWTTFNSKSLLGGALLGQKKYADAEPLLRAGYQAMEQQEKIIPAEAKVRLTEALERLVQLDDDLGKKDESAKLRKELDSRKAALRQLKHDDPHPSANGK